MEDYLVFDEQEEYEPSSRMYAPLPLEYYKEMRFLTDEEFGRLIRILLHFNLTGKVLEGKGTLCHYVDRVIGRQIRFYRDWEELTQKRKKAGQKSGESRRRKSETQDVKKDESTFVQQKEHVLKNSNYTNSNSDSNSDSNSNSNSDSNSDSNSNSNREAAGASPSISPAAPGREEVSCGNSSQATVAQALQRLLGVRLTKPVMEELRQYVDRLGVDTCLFAVERGAEEGRGNWSYVRGILRDLDRNGVTDRPQAENNHRRHSEKKNDRNGVYATHNQTSYTALELQAIAEALAEEL